MLSFFFFNLFFLTLSLRGKSVLRECSVAEKVAFKSECSCRNGVMYKLEDFKNVE